MRRSGIYLFTMCLLIANVVVGQAIVIPDAKFKECILSKAATSLDKSELAKIKTLNCINRGIKSIEGVQYMTGLDTLNVSRNELSSITSSHLDLPNLTFLDVSSNYLSFDDIYILSQPKIWDDTHTLILSPQFLPKITVVNKMVSGEQQLFLSIPEETNDLNTTYYWNTNKGNYTLRDNPQNFTNIIAKDQQTDYIGVTCEYKIGMYKWVMSYQGRQPVLSKGCIESKNVSIQLIPGSCKENTSVKIDVSSGNAPYQYQIKSTSGSDARAFSSMNVFHDLEDNTTYNLVITDKDGCSLEWDSAFATGTRTSDCAFELSPNGDGVNDEYFIEEAGSVRIFNINGDMMKKMDAPTYWRGRDTAGQLCPTGYYIIKNETTGNYYPVVIIR